MKFRRFYLREYMNANLHFYLINSVRLKKAAQTEQNIPLRSFLIYRSALLNTSN